MTVNDVWPHLLFVFLFGVLVGRIFGGELGVRKGAHEVRGEAVKNGVAEWHVTNQYGKTAFRWIKK